MSVETELKNSEKSESDEQESDFNSNNDEENSEIDDESGGGGGEGNAAWANVIKNILQQKKKKNKRTLILSKATKLDELKKRKLDKKSYDFEIEGETVKEEKEDDKSEIVKDSTNELKLISERKQKKDRIFSLHVRPSIVDLERERAFKKIATKGVVQLFNAVKTQQQAIEKTLSETKLDHQRDRALNSINKGQFLDMLMSGNRAKSELVDNPIKEEVKDEKDNKSWGIFRDDFLTNKKISNWDKDEDEDNEKDKEEDLDSGSDDD